MEFHFPHCALIHRSVWKGVSPKSVSSILHSLVRIKEKRGFKAP